MLFTIRSQKNEDPNEKGTGQFLSNLGDSIFSGDPDQDNVVKTVLGYDAAKRQFAFEFGIDP